MNELIYTVTCFRIMVSTLSLVTFGLLGSLFGEKVTFAVSEYVCDTDAESFSSFKLSNGFCYDDDDLVTEEMEAVMASCIWR